MNPGIIVEFLQGKELALGFCITAENKGKFQILNSSGRKETLAPKKVLYSYSTALSGTSSRESILEALESRQLVQQKSADQLDLEELWELLLEEELDKDWGLPELGEFLFSGEISTEQNASLFRALTQEKHRFYRKANVFRIRTREQVEEALTREAVEAKREIEREVLKNWLASVYAGKPKSVDTEFEATIEHWTKRIRDAAIHGEKSSHHAHVHRLLKGLDGKTRDPAFAFMIRLGEWDVDVNLDLLANETPLVFPPEALEDANLAVAHLEEAMSEPEREDFTAWDCYSVDDPDTTEVDDALGFRETDDGYELAIHIADASALLRPELESLEKEARYRATTVYLPDLKARMLPQNLSDEALSLTAGIERLAFSFLVNLDKQGCLTAARMTPSRVQVTKRLDYQQADALVESGDEYWSQLAEIAELLKQDREKNGAINLPFPRMDVRLEGKEIRLVPDNRESKAQTIVSECAILANRVAADYCADHGLPVIYRGQKAPEPPIEMRSEWGPHHLYQVRRSFSKSTQGTDPTPHSGLGLERYIQATSPIRRYRDLVHQRQLKHHLKTGEVLYDLQAIEEIMTQTSTSVTQAERMERNRKAYFLHKYLKKQLGAELDAVVLNSTSERYTLRLEDSFREVDVPHGSGTLRAPGERVRVKLISVYPRDRVVKVSPPL